MKFPNRILFAALFATVASLASAYADDPPSQTAPTDALDSSKRVVETSAPDRTPASDRPGTFILNRATVSVPEPSQ